MESQLTAAQVSARIYREPSVDIRAEGIAGYTVVYHGIDGSVAELRKFTFGDHAQGTEMQKGAERAHAHRRAVSREARAYRDGVAEGIFRASFMLQTIVGAGS